MKVQAVDMTELRRRIDHKIYDEQELELALSWAKAHFRFGEDKTRSSIVAMNRKMPRSCGRAC